MRYETNQWVARQVDIWGCDGDAQETGTVPNICYDEVYSEASQSSLGKWLIFLGVVGGFVFFCALTALRTNLLQEHHVLPLPRAGGGVFGGGGCGGGGGGCGGGGC